MSPKHFQHQIVRLNGANQPLGKYQLKISSLDANGEPQRAQWNFQTFKGLLKFVQKHFPDSDLLEQASNLYIQFRVVPICDDLCFE